jgi:beta-glucosidase
MNQLGDYFAKPVLQDVITILEGIREIVSPNTEIKYVKGCHVLRTNLNEIDEARQAAQNADVAIVVLGENERGAKDEQGNSVGTDGEGRDVASLDLTGLQQELVEAVYNTGTPTVVVLVNGRPLSIRWIAEQVPAIVEAWLPGEKGGTAVAEILFGDYNPDGRLPITIPRHSGQLPVYYNYKPSKEFWINRRRGEGYVDMPATPLYHFGHGLSYTTFEYSNLQISPPDPGTGSTVQVKADVANTGDRRGGEVVQLYINDVISSVSTPVIELKGFKKIWLDPGEKQTVTFTLTPKEFALLDQEMKWVVEPGTFKVMVGHASDDIRLEGGFEVARKR